ncbi:hypothetical protein G3N55_05310 [Dissulfurirhabdus thermomarina]|uniref:Flagellar biosynthesis protein FlhB n=1 Tax=Dissulfurirhabdus thermomarina TaxID=1765737 RepID=A0A6N9TP95_DISTH|nr:EscU/YscU/HrcU family type III secretion system export apparatus switch protein [Dissulfurirhabdus thermomarina]NDY42260.1 hypothetical protein [Dissulfurirhabdus thermomarina]NMX22765.1 hypothetical protein [Dissulfurirhabdus thermomarina]
MGSSREGPRKKAVALRYDEARDAAPRVTAKGEGLLAERILALAREAGVPVREEPDLVEVLSRLEVNREIPAETYVVVAEILAWIYGVNEAARGARPAGSAEAAPETKGRTSGSRPDNALKSK